jgi:chromosome partitioning protein
MISVLVANTKGGCGKTTIATHLAAAFASGGLKTALADGDRQKSSLGWLGRRPFSARPIGALDWSEDVHKVPKGIDRLVIDGAASMKRKATHELIRMADVIVVPVLPSVWDQRATEGFLAQLAELKPIRKNKKPVAVVRNRVRPRSKAAERLDRFLEGVEHRDLGALPDRAIYEEVAASGLSVFDLRGLRAVLLKRDWDPLLGYVDEPEALAA